MYSGVSFPSGSGQNIIKIPEIAEESEEFGFIIEMFGYILSSGGAW